MLFAFGRLADRVWANMLAQLGTTTTAVVVFTVLVPLGGFLLSLVPEVRVGRKSGLSVARIIGDSLLKRASLVAASLTLVAWTGLFVWIFTRTVYREHDALVSDNQELRRDKEILERKDKTLVDENGRLRAQAPPATPAASHVVKSLSPAEIVDRVNSLSLELRVTCDLKEAAPLPPQEAMWMPMAGATAEMRGSGTMVPLQFISPVIFRRQTNNEIVVINRFALTADSDIAGRPISSLAAYEQLFVPIQTIVYGKSFSRVRLAEASITINGRDVWYYQYKIDTDWPEGRGMTVSFPLKTLLDKLK